jgi:hypothetical protein
MNLTVVMTQGVQDISCADWELVISLLFEMFKECDLFEFYSVRLIYECCTPQGGVAFFIFKPY